MQDIFTEASFPLEIIGITIALLGFSGADKWVEQALRTAMQNWQNNAPWVKSKALYYLPTWKNLKACWIQIVISFATFAAGCIIIWPLYLRDHAVARARVDPILNAISYVWEWNIFAAMAIAIILTYAWYIFSLMAFSFLIWLQIGILWRIVWLLSRPPSGVLGSIGLAVALYNPAIQYISGMS